MFPASREAVQGRGIVYGGPVVMSTHSLQVLCCTLKTMGFQVLKFIFPFSALIMQSQGTSFSTGLFSLLNDDVDPQDFH